MTTLTNIYSAEKHYFISQCGMTQIARGIRIILAIRLKNNLFIIKPAGQKGSVWYDPNELIEIEQRQRLWLQISHSLQA